MIRLSDNLSLPLDAVTQTFGFFGRKGSGKTYSAGKLAELMLAEGLQVVVLDPVGVWYGLRLDKTGKKPSAFTLPVLGGEHGDVPLNPGGGVVAADFLVATGSSAVLDVSRFRKHERKEFVTAFAEQLFHKKKSSRAPMHLIIEEAHMFAPQKTFKGEERMLGAMEDIVRLGRNYGIGASMVSQRPQSINTELRNQCEPLVVFQEVAKHERDAIGGWMEHMGVDSELKELAKLKNGECFFWSPAWLDRFIKTRFLPKETFDASATPKVGSKAYEPEKLAPVDLTALEAAMKDTIEKAKADDPAELRKKLQVAERKIAELARRPAEKEPERVEVPVPLISANDMAQFELAEQLFKQRGEEIARHAEQIIGTGKLVSEQLAGIKKALDEFKRPAGRNERVPLVPNVPKVPGVFRTAGTARSVRPGTNGTAGTIGGADLPSGEKKILVAIAQHGSVERDQLTVLTGYKRSSRDAYLQRLQQKNFIEITSRGIESTREGVAALGNDYEPLPTGQELQEYWMNRLPLGERKILAEIVRAFPKTVDRELLSNATGYLRSSRDAYLQRLQSRRLVESVGRGEVRASENLFG